MDAVVEEAEVKHGTGQRYMIMTQRPIWKPIVVKGKRRRKQTRTQTSLTKSENTDAFRCELNDHIS
eukprot:scaffold5450_cov103-Skeletonema_dohrnii-CCMP3373.AAC.2